MYISFVCECTNLDKKKRKKKLEKFKQVKKRKLSAEYATVSQDNSTEQLSFAGKINSLYCCSRKRCETKFLFAKSTVLQAATVTWPVHFVFYCHVLYAKTLPSKCN